MVSCPGYCMITMAAPAAAIEAVASQPKASSRIGVKEKTGVALSSWWGRVTGGYWLPDPAIGTLPKQRSAGGRPYSQASPRIWIILPNHVWPFVFYRAELCITAAWFSKKRWKGRTAKGSSVSATSHLSSHLRARQRRSGYLHLRLGSVDFQQGRMLVLDCTNVAAGG